MIGLGITVLVALALYQAWDIYILKNKVEALQDAIRQGELDAKDRHSDVLSALAVLKGVMGG